MTTRIAIAAILAYAWTAQAQEKVTYADHVRPLLENKCFSCHNPDKKKGDLDLTSFAGAMTGGGGGAIIAPGDPEGSKLIGTLTRKVEPFMPPEGGPLGAKDIDMISKWIQGGVLETASSLAKKAAPRTAIALTVVGKGKPQGPLPMPEGVLLEPVVTAPRSTTITALAANPWSPLVAVSGLKQALVYDLKTQTLAGIYPYPEGYLMSLKFSQSGGLLIGGGGRGGKNGNAVVWDVKTGKRVTEVGKEFDQVMSADISPNQAMIALGGPSKKVKCYNTSSGEELYVIKKHTEWIMEVAFSPDGVLLATADRNGGIIISEAASGGEFYVLDGHKAACTGLAWRADSNLLASCSDDGKVALWEMEGGKLVKSWDAHSGGCQSVAFTPDGRVVSSGRDAVMRLWDASGKKLAESKSQGDLVTRVAGGYDNQTLVSGDWAGNVRFWSAPKIEEIGIVSSNPSPIARRIVETEKRTADMVAELPVLEGNVKKAEETVKAKEAQLADTRKKTGDAAAYRQKLEAEINAIPGQIDSLKKTVADTQAKRQTQVEVIRKYEQDSTQAKKLELVVGNLDKAYNALVAEAAKLTQPDQAPKKAEADQKAGLKKTELAARKSELEGLKKAVAAAPQSMADFDKAIKNTQEQIVSLNNAKPKKTKELEAVKKGLESWPKAIADADKQLADAKALVPEAQATLKSRHEEIAFLQKRPVFLRAAQFNTGLLTEKDKLAKIDADVTGYKEGFKDTEAAKAAAADRIVAAKKVIAETTPRLPVLDSALSRQMNELPGVEKILDPSKAQEAQVFVQLNAQRKILEQKEAALAALTKDKSDRAAAAQKAAAEITGQLGVLHKQLDEVGKKAEAPLKTADVKKTALAQAESDLNAAKKQPAAEANKQVQAKEKIVAQVRQEFEAAEKIAAPLRGQLHTLAAQIETHKQDLAQKQAEPAAVEQEFAAKVKPLQDAIAQSKTLLAPLDKQMTDIRAKLAADTRIIEAKRAEVGKAQADLAAAKKLLADNEKTITSAQKEITDKEKMIVDLKTELAKLEPQLEPQRAKVKQMTDQYLAMLPK